MNTLTRIFFLTLLGSSALRTQTQAGPYSTGADPDQSTVVSSIDLNGDQLVDFEIHHDIWMVWTVSGGGWYEHFGDVDVDQYRLGAKGTNVFLETGALLGPGDAVALQPSGTNSWSGDPVNLLIPVVPLEGWPGMSTVAYVGVRFAAVDGEHVGWLHFTNQAVLSDSAWQPALGSSILVGEHPQAGPPPQTGWTTELPISADPKGTLDFLYRTRQWTNETTGVVGLSVRLLPTSGLQVLSAPGQIDGQAALFPVTLPGHLVIPFPAPEGAAWQSTTNDLVLLERSGKPGASGFSQVGPLAQALPVYLAVATATGDALGWLRFDQNLMVSASGFGVRVVGEPTPAPGEVETTVKLVDINTDGLIDFVIRDYCCFRYGSSATILVPVGSNQILMTNHPPASLTESYVPDAPEGFFPSLPVEASDLIATGPSNFWRQAKITLTEYAPGGYGEGSQGFRVEGLLGVRFATTRGDELGFVSPVTITANTWARMGAVVSSGLTVGPPALNNIVAVAAGAGYSLALTEDNRVIGWGENGHGQTELGVGMSNLVALAAGDDHSLALTSDGAVIAAGFNHGGDASVPAGLSNVVAIAAGGSHSLALTAEGRVVAWGDNSLGQTDVPAGLNGVIAIAAGKSHSLALTADGLVVAWGNGWVVPSGLGKVVAIAAADEHNLALTGQGQVVAWGESFFGVSTVPSSLSNVVAISAAGHYSLALTSEGRVVGWGHASILGEDDWPSDPLDVPVVVPLDLGNVVALAAGFDHRLALLPSPGVVFKSQVVSLGSDVTLVAPAGVGCAVSSQWSFKGTNLLTPGIGNTLRLDHLLPSQVGTYTAVSAFPFGQVTNAVIRLVATQADTGLTVTTSPDPAGSGTLVHLSFPTAPGNTYTVEYRNSLAAGPDWQPLPGGPHNTGSVVESNQDTQRFYRVRVEVP